MKKTFPWNVEGSCIRSGHALDAYGYPRMYRNGKSKTIARWILIRRHGEIPVSVVSRHTCDNRWCIRPDHILSGTQAQNVSDGNERGRYDVNKGENSPRSKLTSVQVLQIRESTESKREIAKRFGITEWHVDRIRNRIRWGHL